MLENDGFIMYYDRTIITDNQVTINRPDIVILNKTLIKYSLLTLLVQNSNKLFDKQQEKQPKYAYIAIEINKI